MKISNYETLLGIPWVAIPYRLFFCPFGPFLRYFCPRFLPHLRLTFRTPPPPPGADVRGLLKWVPLANVLMGAFEKHSIWRRVIIPDCRQARNGKPASPQFAYVPVEECTSYGLDCAAFAPWWIGCIIHPYFLRTINLHSLLTHSSRMIMDLTLSIKFYLEHLIQMLCPSSDVTKAATLSLQSSWRLYSPAPPLTHFLLQHIGCVILDLGSAATSLLTYCRYIQSIGRCLEIGKVK
jgi:hypothetical protein